MPLPGATGIPLFEGVNATEFLDRFEDLCKEYSISDQDKFNRLPRYCSRSVGDVVRSLKEWEQDDYLNLRKAILQEYKEHDSYQQTYSLQFLERYKSVKRTERDDILQYCRQFNMVATYLKKRGALSEYTMGIWFLHGLPPSVSAKVVRKFGLDTEDPSTIKYETIFEYVERSMASERAVQRMHAERAPDPVRSEELKELVDRYQAIPTIPKEKRHADPVGPQSTVSSEVDKVVDRLTQSFDKLSISMGTLVQQSIDRVTKVQQPEVGATAVGVNAFSGASSGANMSGICFYCFNRRPEFPPHRFRNQCPWYLSHKAKGVCHLNADNRLCVGPEREGAPTIFLQRGMPQGNQVVLRTAGTEYDENPENRPKKEVSTGSKSVGALSILGNESDDDDVEEIEGYGIVNVVEVIETNAARIDSRERETRAKWSNPTKILKKKAETENSYALGKNLRAGTWMPATVVEGEVVMEVETDEAMTVAPEKKPRATKTVPTRKFVDVLKEKANPEGLLDEIMDQRVSIRLRDILTSSDSLTKLMFKGLPMKEIDVKVGSTSLRQSERTYAAATPKIRVKIGNTYADAMLDSGAEVNVMTRALANRAELTVRTNLALALKTVSGERRKFDGACEEVEVSVGGISNTQTIMVIDEIDHKLILGCLFFHDAQLTFVYDDEGYQCAKFTNEDRTKIATTRVCRPQSREWREARVQGAEESGNE
jgi:hypothetical protein